MVVELISVIDIFMINISLPNDGLLAFEKMPVCISKGMKIK